MSQLLWDQDNERLYETGVKKGVVFPKDASGKYTKGVAWNGLTEVNETPSGAESNPLYANDNKYLNLVTKEEFGCSIGAYTYPEEFEVCDGSAALVEGVKGVKVGQQPRREFGFSWVTTVGNDSQGVKFGYKIHVAYNLLATPSEKGYATINADPEAITFNWDCTSTPVNIGIEGFEPTAIVTIDSTKLTTETEKAGLKALENKLYGTAEEEPTLPTIKEIAVMFGWTEPTAA